MVLHRIQESTITVTATDGISQASGTMTINTSYSEELHQPASTTRKLAMSFNGGGQGKSGDYSITTNGSPTFNNSGGTLNSGYVSGFTTSTNFQIDDFQQLIQEEIIHLSHGIKAHRQAVLTMFINQL